ncbi:menaquinone biosynthesis protein [Vampirovibrio sp.]|uniref:menaquinone biosynthesis protein n=1 Tax=Vampirovibrio sp. TaxID=2717857 RepID=UPI003593E63C
MTNIPYNVSSQPIRLGAISFVNTIPIYANFCPNNDVTLVYEVPARLNAMMRTGTLDISPVSSAYYLRNQEQLVLLDDLSVSSPGAVESVLFLSRTSLGPELLALDSIQVPNDSETSVMLLAYLLQAATGHDLRSRFQVYEAAHYPETLRQTGNALIIGDNALMMKASLSQQTQPYYCYDLSTLWREKTGLPFVFAVWVANRTWAEANPERLQAINTDLQAARDEFFRDPDIFNQGLQTAQASSGLTEETLRRYYTQCLTYGLSSQHLASLNRFESIIQTFEPVEALPLDR